MTAEHELEVARQQIAALQEEVARLRTQTEAERATNELRSELVTVGAAAALSAPDQHSSLLEQIVQTAMHVLRARAGSLYLLDEDSEELIFEVALGDRAASLRGRRLPLGQGVANWVAATGRRSPSRMCSRTRAGLGRSVARSATPPGRCSHSPSSWATCDWRAAIARSGRGPAFLHE